MPDLHRAAQAYLSWTVDSDGELVTTPSVAFYKSDAPGAPSWRTAEWVGDSYATTEGGVTTHHRVCRALVAGFDKIDPDPTAIILGSLGNWINVVRINDTPEAIPLAGELVKVFK